MEHVKDNIYKQKSKIQWLKLGDSNTTYFFTNIKGKRAQNNIKQLTAATGELIQDAKGVEEN